MKKKMKLKRWVKVLITLITIITGIIVYLELKDLGANATTNQLAGTLCILGWGYLIFGQLSLLIALWEEE